MTIHYYEQYFLQLGEKPSNASPINQLKTELIPQALSKPGDSLVNLLR